MALTTHFNGFVSCVLILLRIPLSPLFFGSSCTYTFDYLFTCKYCIVLLYIFVLYTGCNYILFFHFLYFIFFLHDHGVYAWLLQAYIKFSIYSHTSTGIKGMRLRRLSCVLTLRISFMSAAGVDDHDFLHANRKFVIV